eukprot:scaffold49011_cov60-Phaeocystis_antarctica.AAC.1
MDGRAESIQQQKPQGAPQVYLTPPLNQYIHGTNVYLGSTTGHNIATLFRTRHVSCFTSSLSIVCTLRDGAD